MTLKNKLYHNYLIGISIVFIVAAAMYSFVYFIIIPATAKALLPYKWSTLTLNQPQNIINTYLGKPEDTNLQTDTWFARINNYNYQLTLHYNSADSLADKYFIHYSFKNNLFIKSGSLAADSTK
jgi:hypothetical protein